MDNLSLIQAELSSGGIAVTMLAKLDDYEALGGLDDEATVYLQEQRKHWHAELRKASAGTNLTNLVISLDCQAMQITPIEKLALITLSFYCVNQHIAHVTFNQLSNKSGLSLSSLKRAVKTLKERGFINSLQTKAAQPNAYDLGGVLLKAQAIGA
ncbi:winged helix-turn-helix domain-containing protein [Thaumasiovibrio sp. DFM-14]|uniref:winged helix-turn-helix domain-containing protein n=1 Tax=Thaumasiovibrio sp. DFM-14 TaxID=3384792 RepID=UPI0039A36A93